MEKLTYSLDEVVEATGLSKSTIIRQINAGHLPSVLVGSRRLVRRVDLERFLEERTAA